MNPTEQRTHTTALRELERQTENLFAAMAVKMAEDFGRIQQQFEGRIDLIGSRCDGITEGTKLSLRALDQTIHEMREHLTSRLVGLEQEFLSMERQCSTFWGRLTWLVVGPRWKKQIDAL